MYAFACHITFVKRFINVIFCLFREYLSPFAGLLLMHLAKFQQRSTMTLCSSLWLAGVLETKILISPTEGGVMPKPMSSAMKTHMAGETTSLCTIWEIEREDGRFFRFTDHDLDIVFNGDTYEAALGYTPSAVDTSGDMAVDTMETRGILSSEFITDRDLTAGLWDYASVLCMMVNYNDLSMGAVYMRCGRLGEISTGRAQFTAELRGLAQNLQQTLGETFTSTCQANLGDARCKVDLTPYTFEGAVIDFESRARIFTDLSKPDGSFKGGLITWTSGANAGLVMEIKDSLLADGAILLQVRMPYAIEIGDEFMARFGCDKLDTTCQNKFGNMRNFRGFNILPGMDKYVTGKA